MTKPKPKVTPEQNVSPTSSVHFDANNNVMGASRSLDGGVPLRLSIAAGLLGHVFQRYDGRVHERVMTEIALTLADQLISEYNKQEQEDKEAP